MHVTDNADHDPTLASRYLADQLTEEERAAFEARLIEEPDLLQELEATARLKVGLENLRKSGQLDRLVKTRSVLRQPAWLALAASVAVLMVGVVLWRGTQQAQPLMLAASASLISSAGQQLPLGRSYALLRTRSQSYDETIELGTNAQAIELRVMPDVKADPAQYRVTLSRVAQDGSASEVASVGALPMAEDGFVTFYADSSQLSPGRYQLSISGDAGTSAANEAETFLIRAVAAER